MRPDLPDHGGWAPYVWLNGENVPAAEARVSVFDRGILLGDGVYETLRVHRCRIFRWRDHGHRLLSSLAAAGIEPPHSLAALEEAIAALVRANQMQEARIRLTITRGEGDPGFDLMPGKEPSTIVAASAWRPLPEKRYREGVRAVIASRRQTGSDSLDPALKSISRIHLVLARLEATRMKAQEAILLGSDGKVREGTASNVFLVKQGALRTPSAQCGILEGVTRAAILELASAAGIPCEEGILAPEELQGADEIFLTNTSWGALPVGELDGKPVGGGRGGPVALILGQKLSELVERECAP
ncbi:MAG: aminotransferase class IV [Acidobacteria bacterium]|nr:aminotransferase class IV [Acidobacteriota bacterium]